jgi:C-methyltransferase.
MLLADGFDVTGFDPTYEGSNPRIVKEYFKPGVMKSSRGLILRHVLEHVPDPYRFLCDLRDANGGTGLIYIEVPCFDWICKKRAWFDIFYEHVNYFRMLDFFKMCGSVYASGKLFGDQYLYVVADLATLRAPKYAKKDAIHFPQDFLASLNHEEQSRAEQSRAEQSRAEQSRAEQSAVVWGGASKGVIFSLLRERIGNPVSAVVDVNPAKQGKFLPVTGLHVLSPETLLSHYAEAHGLCHEFKLHRRN